MGKYLDEILNTFRIINVLLQSKRNVEEIWTINTSSLFHFVSFRIYNIRYLFTHPVNLALRILTSLFLFRNRILYRNTKFNQQIRSIVHDRQWQHDIFLFALQQGNKNK